MQYWLYYCIADINECLSRPCYNGAICLDEVARYTCVCAPGYEGINCQIGRLKFSKLSKETIVAGFAFVFVCVFWYVCLCVCGCGVGYVGCVGDVYVYKILFLTLTGRLSVRCQHY